MRLRTNESGFTLLELLVAITLLAFLSLGLVAGLRFGTNIWRKSEEKNVGLNGARVAAGIIGGSLARIYPKYIVVSPEKAYVDFDGTADRVTFLSTSKPQTGSLMRDTLEAVRDGRGLAVRIVMTPELARGGAGATSQALLRGLSSVVFSYFGAAGDEKEPVWHSSWQGQTALPKLIHIHVASSDPGQPPFPDMILAPKIAADVGCVYDAVTKFCRGRQ
jgi:general secretion pathway protein J